MNTQIAVIVSLAIGLVAGWNGHRIYVADLKSAARRATSRKGRGR